MARRARGRQQRHLNSMRRNERAREARAKKLAMRRNQVNSIQRRPLPNSQRIRGNPNNPTMDTKGRVIETNMNKHGDAISHNQGDPVPMGWTLWECGGTVDANQQSYEYEQFVVPPGGTFIAPTQMDCYPIGSIDPTAGSY